LGRPHRNSSHTVRASSIRLEPGLSRTTSRISVTSRALKVRTENVKAHRRESVYGHKSL